MRQTKITKTIKHTDSQWEHIVCEGILKFISVEKNKCLPHISNTGFEYLIPVIISDGEKIESDELYLTDSQHILDSAKYGPASVDKKVLVFPNQFSPKHVQAILDGKLKNEDKVYIECEDWNDDINSLDTPADNLYKTIKLDKDGHVKLFKPNYDNPNDSKKLYMKIIKKISNMSDLELEQLDNLITKEGH